MNNEPFFCDAVGPNRTEASCMTRLEKGWCTECKRFRPITKTEERGTMRKCSVCGKEAGPRAVSCTSCGGGFDAGRRKLVIKAKAGNPTQEERREIVDKLAETETSQTFKELIESSVTLNSDVVAVNFSWYPELYKCLNRMAIAEFRTPEGQILALLDDLFTKMNEQAEETA